MKALVLAGGSGTRLRPLSYAMPKQLIPVGNTPVLFRCLQVLRDAGITEVGVVINETDTQIRAALGDGSQFGQRLTYIPQHAPLGLAHCVRIAEPFLGDDDFVMYLGDNILLDDLSVYVDSFLAHPSAAQILVTRVSQPCEYGIAELAPDGTVTSLQEKPQRPRSDLAVVGIYFFTPAVHEVIRTLRPSARGELEITDALQALIHRGDVVRVQTITGYWKDTGRIEDLLDCNREILDGVKPTYEGTLDRATAVGGSVSIGAGTHIRRSRIIGPVIIGSGAHITDCTIGPYVAVGDNAVLNRTTMTNSIAMDRVLIDGVANVAASVIGRDTQVVGTRQHRIIAGDNSRIEVIAAGP
jgi:glucose-1-phosphate thymidylyltransferase